MPYTGYDPFGPDDPSGGGLDPSAYYALSPGGRFPGDTQNYLEYLAAQSRGTAGGNPDYDVPDWMTRLGRIGRMLGAHERNVQQGGEGQVPSDVGGYPYQFWSGPGAYYGPPGGPLHGLVDQGRPTEPWDGTDHHENGTESGGGGRHRGGGGGPKMSFSFTPYQGMAHQSSFVDWQPTAPGTGADGPTRFVHPSVYKPSAQIPPLGGGGGGVAGRGGNGGGGTKGAGRGGRGGRGRGGNGGGKPSPGKPTAAPTPADDLLALLLGSRGTPNRFGAAQGPGLRGSVLGGVDVNNIDKGTPGWQQDPTTGIANTRGMPNGTPFGPDPGESFDHYLTRLHDSGLDSDAIGSMLGPNGFRQNDAGEWEWGWGTGPVVHGPNGYQFANQGNQRIGMTTGGGTAGGGGQGSNAADTISGGVFYVPAV